MVMRNDVIKAVFFDIDGTLVSFHTHKVPESAVKAVESLRKSGVKVFISTGRPYSCIDNLGTMEFDGYLTLNGGTFLDSSRQVLFSDSLPDEDVVKLVERINRKGIPCAFVRNSGVFINFVNDTVRKALAVINFPYPEILPAERALDSKVQQAICFMDEALQPEIMDGLAGTVATRWSPYFADVIPLGTNKAEGVSKVASLYGFSREQVMAFGDGGNDIEMLGYAGIGVALGNASDAVKAAADYVTSSVDEDGVYKALLHFGLL